MDICPNSASKHNSNREKQVTLLMIPNGEGWHYLAIRKLSPLIRGITSKLDGKSHKNHIKKVREKKVFFNTVLPFEDTRILIKKLINTRNLPKHDLLFKQILNF